MDPEETTKKNTEGLRLSLEIGNRVGLMFQGQEKSMKALFIGMEPGHYLIVRLSGINGWHDHLFEGNTVSVKYVSAGMVYGFQSSCRGYYFERDLILVILSYPEEVKTYELRSEQRIESCIPAMMTLGPENYPGFMLDLSPRGCGFALSRSADKSSFKAGPGQEVTLTFHLPDIEGPQVIPCQIKNIRDEEQTIMLGLLLDLKTEATFSLGIFHQFIEEKDRRPKS